MLYLSKQDVLNLLILPQSTKDAVAALKAKGLMDPKLWEPCGGLTRNGAPVADVRGIMEAQMGNPIAALKELITNALDALLEMKCQQYSVAPRSISDALLKFYKINSIYDFTKKKIKASDIADDLPTLMATGMTAPKKGGGYPCYTLIDNSLGEYSSNFDATFNGLMGSGKVGKPYLLGSYGMGSNGVLAFTKLKVILTRRRPSMNSSALPDDQYWCGGIVMKWDPDFTKGEFVHSYRILKFVVKETVLPLLPLTWTGDSKHYGRNKEYGTVIKLFEYETKHASIIDQNLTNELEFWLPRPPLPFGVMDTRYGGVDKAPSRSWAHGLEHRFQAEGYQKNLFCPPIVHQLDLGPFGNAHVTAYILSGSLKDVVPVTDRVYYTLNGQTQHAVNKMVFNKVQLGILQEHLMVGVNLDHVTIEGKSAFMSNRSSMKEGEFKSLLDRELFDWLKSAPEIRAAVAHFANKRTKATTDDEFMKTVGAKFQRFLSNILKTGTWLKDNGAGGTGREEKEKATRESRKPIPGLYWPTYVSVSGSPVETPINARIHFSFRTDADNNYFSILDRPVEDLGRVVCLLNGKIHRARAMLFNGGLLVSADKVNPSDIGCKVGDTVDIAFTIGDKFNQWSYAFRVKLLPEEIKEAPQKVLVNPPKWEPVYAKDWETCTPVMTEDSGFVVEELPEQTTILINMDNRHLQSLLFKSELTDVVKTQYTSNLYTYGVAIWASLVKKELSLPDAERETFSKFEIAHEASKGIAMAEHFCSESFNSSALTKTDDAI